MGKKILLAVLAVLVAGGGASAIVASRVKHAPPLQVQRGTFVAAPPATVIAEIANLENWVAWSHEKDDPTIRRTYGGPRSGRGASYYWSSTDGAVGGRLTVISVGPDTVELELEQVSPDPGLMDYTIKATLEGSGTRLVWSEARDGDDGLLGKALDAAKNRDQRMGNDLESRLAGLKAVMEAQENMQAYRVERSTRIAAPDLFVLAEIMDFREWSKWLPREQLDPDLKRVFSGSDAQPGSTYFWSGNDEVGAGRLSMISSSAEKVELEVELDKPMESTSDLVFTLAREGAETRVVWTVSGDKNASGKGLTLLGISPETLAGDMEEALANLKALSEAAVPGKGGRSGKSPEHPTPQLRILADPIVLRRSK